VPLCGVEQVLVDHGQVGRAGLVEGLLERVDLAARYGRGGAPGRRFARRTSASSRS
jgi:hypothetical protein